PRAHALKGRSRGMAASSTQHPLRPRYKARRAITAIRRRHSDLLRSGVSAAFTLSAPASVGPVPGAQKRGILPANPWLAIDATTAPQVRAREVRRAWERFMAGAPTAGASESADLRAPITASWERSQEAGVNPFVERVAPAVADADEVAARWEGHALSAMAPLSRAYVGEAAGDAQGIIVVTDAQGTVLWIDGDPNVRFDAAGMINLQEGASWSEADAGTNAIGTGFSSQHAVQVFATEHFNQVVHAWVCAAAPVRDPDRGELLGIIDVTGRSSTAHPYSFASAVATAGAVEAHLRSAMLGRDARLRARYEEGIRRGGRRVLVSTTGRILSSHPDGWVS